jgi:hypothetical protein
MNKIINKTIKSLFESQEDCRIYCKGGMYFYGKITNVNRDAIEFTVFDKDFTLENENAMSVSKIVWKRSAVIGVGYGWQYLKKAQLEIAEPSVENRD